MQVPYINHKQISKLDDLMVNYFNIPVVMMMENAGYRMAEFIRKQFPTKKRILLVCGKGNNGGDGIAAARHLLNFGYEPTIFLITKKISKEPLIHLKIAKKLQIPMITTTKELRKEIVKQDIVYDCLIGYNLKGGLKKEFKKVVEIINQIKKPIIACDIPSGIDTDKGAIHKEYINATHILFLSLPKIGCKKIKAKKFVADIGIPKALYAKINVKSQNYFKKETIIKT